MIKILGKIFVNAVAIFITAYLLPTVTVSNLETAIMVAIVLALLNFFIKPILLLFALPLNLATMGLFTLVINGLLVYLTPLFVPQFQVADLGAAIIFSIVLSIVSWFLYLFV